MTDAFSNFIVASPTKDTSAVATLDAFMKDWVANFGLPDSIHTDRGTNFESRLMSMVCAQFGIRKTRTSAHHPMSNGLCERAVGQVKRTLRLHVATWPNQWDRSLHFCLMTLRSGIHTRTGISPARLFLGREMRTIGDVITNVNTEKLAGDQRPYADRLLTDVHKIQELTRKKIEISKIKQKSGYDRSAYSENLKVGSKVIKRIIHPYGTSRPTNTPVH